MDEVSRVLKTQLFAGKRSRIFETMTAAAKLLADQPEGSRHVVLITDGVETPGGKVDLDEALKQIRGLMATVHVISYTTLVRQKDDKQPSKITAGQLPKSSNPITANDPTLPSGVTRITSFDIARTFEPEMRCARKAYELGVKIS